MGRLSWIIGWVALAWVGDGCLGEVALPADDGAVDASDAVTVPSPPWGFSWVEDGLGAMGHPGSAARADRTFSWLSAQGVELVVSLTLVPPEPEALAPHGIGLLHLPIKDLTAPTLAQIEVFVAAVGDALGRGGRATVHCSAGLGRTGTMVAAWFVAQGEAPGEAIEHVRRLRPGSIETPAQEAIVHEWAASER